MDKSIPQSHQLVVCVQKRHRLEPIAPTRHPRAADGRSLPRVSRDREPGSLSNLLREGDVGSPRDALRHKRHVVACRPCRLTAPRTRVEDVSQLMADPS